MVKAVITDFDGVIRHWNNQKTRKVEADCKLEVGTLSSICFDAELLQPAITGQITYENWVELAHAKLQKTYGLGVADHFIQAWKSNPYSIDYDLITQYRTLFSDARLVLATNATTRLHEELREANLLHSFDSIFNSSAMGVAKPKKQYFHALLMSMGLRAKDALFVDDSLENVQAAKALGIQSFYYNSRSQLLEELTNVSLQNSVLEY
jgi:putative hydrolase of the HAD superfamily